MGEAVFTGVGKKKFFCGIKIDAKQLKISSSFSGWLRFGANFDDLSPLNPLQQHRGSKNDMLFQNFLRIFLRRVFAVALRPIGGFTSISPSTPLPQH